MRIKTFEEWWESMEVDLDDESARNLTANGSRYYLCEEEAREIYRQLVIQEPEPARCKIMRRLGPMDDTPLGCYVPVAWCDDYGMFEELLKGAKIEHGLICIQEQAKEASEPEPEPEPEQGPFVLLLNFKGEAPYYRGEFDTRKEAQDWAKQEAAFAPPGSRQYKIVTFREWEEFKAKTRPPQPETPHAPDPS